MAFKLGDVIIDRLQFGYGMLNGKALYLLTQLQNATIDITADPTDITDKDGNLVYRKYSGKKGEITATNAFLNLAIAEIVSGTSSEIATSEAPKVMPEFKIVKAGETLDVTGAVEDSYVVNAISDNGSLGKAYTKGSAPSKSEFGVATNTLTPPTDTDETRFLVKFDKKVTNGAKITIGDKYPKVHELYFKALAVDKCKTEDGFRCVVVRVSHFLPSPEVSIALEGGDSQTMDYKGTILTDTCSDNNLMVEIFYIDEEEDV